MDLSIIIPVYNTEKEKLERCFDSITEITGIEYECLVIDDGSEKFVGSTCRELIQDNAHFKYLYKANGGVSAARNYGMNRATGKYITFVDSDDEIIFHNIWKYLSLDKDIVFADLNVISKGATIRWSAFDRETGDINILDVLQRISSTGILNGPVCKFISKKLIDKEKIKFDETMISGEDIVFFMDLLACRPSMYYFKECCYIYYKENITAKRRMLKSPKVVIENNYTMYKKMNELIYKSVDEGEEHLTSLCQQATQRYIKQLFNIATDLELCKELSNHIFILLQNKLMCLDREKISICDSCTKIRHTIIVKDYRFLLWLISRMRWCYLKSRKL